MARAVFDSEQMNEGKRPLFTEYVVTRWYRKCCATYNVMAAAEVAALAWLCVFVVCV